MQSSIAAASHASYGLATQKVQFVKRMTAQRRVRSTVFRIRETMFVFGNSTIDKGLRRTAESSPDSSPDHTSSASILHLTISCRVIQSIRLTHHQLWAGWQQWSSSSREAEPISLLTSDPPATWLVWRTRMAAHEARQRAQPAGGRRSHGPGHPNRRASSEDDWPFVRCPCGVRPSSARRKRP